MLTAQAIYAAFCILFAAINAAWIKENKVINHPLNGGLHLLAWAALAFACKNWWLLAVFPFIGKLFFDTALNVFRALSPAYEPLNPLSFFDGVEEKVFHNGWIAKGVYVVIIILLNVFVL